ncbi:MAG: hypothetical protein JWO03_430 [Bacteroidetes bacterium]|nr:hypothetical protein [Bacteroidota bacterium]
MLIWLGAWEKKLLLLNLAALLLSWPFLRTVISLHLSTGEEKGIRIMSYNVKNFDLYNWTGNSETRAEMMQLIHQENADVICFQEYYSDDEAFRNTEYMRDSLGYKYHYMRITYDKWYKGDAHRKPDHHRWGLAIFSRYAITDSGLVSFGNATGNQCMYADLSVEGKSLRVYNTHLQSIHLDYNDGDAIEEMSETYNTSWHKLKRILRKMKLATTKRTTQAEIVHDHISQYMGPKILCGDFNDAPVSYTYQTISSGMQDAFVQRGQGFGKSFASKLGIFRIDYVFAGPSIMVNSCRTVRRELSDHYPVMVTFSF